MIASGEDRWLRRLLLALLLLVPLVSGGGLFTNTDDPKWALLFVGVAAALLLAFVRAAASREKVRLVIPEQLALLSLLVLLAFFLAKRAPDARATQRAWAAVGVLSAFGIVACRYLEDYRWARRAFTAVAVAAGAAAAWGLIRRLLGDEFGAAATLGNPSFAAEFTAPAGLLCVALFLMGRRTVAAACGTLVLGHLLLAWSRADLLGLAAGLAVLGALTLCRRLRRHPPPRLATAALLLVILLLPYLIAVLPVPLFGRSDTVNVRSHTRAAALEMAADHPVSGIGLEGFEAEYPAYRTSEEYALSLGRQVSFPHNLPARVAAETGLPGVLFLLLFLWVTVFSALKRALLDPEDPVAFGAAGALTAILVSAQFSSPLRHPASALLFFLLAGIVVARRPRRVVTFLEGRYRRAMPVVLLLVPAIVGLTLLPADLVADARMKSARDRIASLDGGLDAEVARRLRGSLRARPNPDAIWMLAFYETGTGRPEAALAHLDGLLTLAPHHVRGRLERARALVALGREAEARPILDHLLEARPGNGRVIGLWVKAGMAEDPFETGQEVFRRLRAEPKERACLWARATNTYAPAHVFAMFDTAYGIGEQDPDRALRVLAEVDSGESYYFAALVLARDGRLDEAMNALRAAVASDAADRDRLEFDPRLEPLRARADFRSLLR